ncbi:pyrroline-5-carboxylate reductase [Candidatus Omnitrophota bacterium]
MKIGIIGCGNMAQAMLRGIAAKNDFKKSAILVSDKDKSKARLTRSRFKVTLCRSNSELVKQADLIILAVKPKDVQSLARDLTGSISGKLLVSICAGLSTKRLEQDFGKVAVIRAMPNMPAQVGQGITAISKGRYARLKHIRLARLLFGCIGEVVQVREGLMDAVTAISGSGPAYFFYLIENLISAAQQFGLTETLARKLAVQTALGSAMILKQSQLSPKDWRIRVASKGGTTQAAFKLFRKKALDKILRTGFEAALRRSKQLQK